MPRRRRPSSQGVYKNLANEYTYSYHLSLLFTISTDIAQCEGSSTTSFREIPTNSHNASTSQISRTWQKLYSAIYDANDFIETVSGRMDNWGSSDRELATIYLGEAVRCVRCSISSWCAGTATWC